MITNPRWVPDKRVRNPYTDTSPPQVLPWREDTPSEDGDALVPEGGFIRDFVYWTKGIESPTEFAIWAALWLLSSLIKRDAWFKWQTEFPLYPNLYVIFVAPPGILKKSTMISRAGFLGYLAPMTVKDEWTASKKILTVHRGKITPEGLHDLLIPEEDYWADHVNGTGQPASTPIARGSQLSLQITELTTFLSKAKYNVGLVDKLTKLYDCESIDDEYTKTDKGSVLKDIYVTFLGATTPDGMRMSMPDEAFGGGFMSRTVVVYSEKITRFYPRPVQLPGAPTSDEMAKRLGWLAERVKGEYDLSPEADEAHRLWYRPFKMNLLKHSEQQMHLRSRLDTILLRMAMLCRAQRYEPGNIIELDDYLAAKKILFATLQDNGNVFDTVGATPFGEVAARLKRFMLRRDAPTWRDIQIGMSRYAKSDEVQDVLQTLYDAGYLAITLDGKEQNTVRRDKDAVYKWVGPRGGIDEDGNEDET